MAIGLQNTQNVTPPDDDFPNGQVQDNNGTGNGTPANTRTLGDFHQFFAKLMRLATINPNNLPDSEYSGFQYVEALFRSVQLRMGETELTDLDGLRYTGIFYALDSFANVPAGFTGGQVTVNETGGIFTATQILTDITTGAQWTRSRQLIGGWTDWVLLRLASKPIPIGVWNMNNDQYVQIAHGITDFTKIRTVSGMIRNDSGNNRMPIGTDILYFLPSEDLANPIGGGGVRANDITIGRKPGSIYSTSGGGGGQYVGTGFSRGDLIVEWIPH